MNRQLLTSLVVLTVLTAIAVWAGLTTQEQPFQAQEQEEAVFETEPISGRVVSVGVDSFVVDPSVNLSQQVPPVTIRVTSRTVITVYGEAEAREGTFADIKAGDDVVVTPAETAGTTREALYIDVFTSE